MSATIVDMPKVTQMLDAGWRVTLYRNGLNSYTAQAVHPNANHMAKLAEKNAGLLEFVDEDGDCVTDDFTPEQALTRLAYKVHGQIL